MQFFCYVQWSQNIGKIMPKIYLDHLTNRVQVNIFTSEIIYAKSFYHIYIPVYRYCDFENFHLNIALLGNFLYLVIIILEIIYAQELYQINRYIGILILGISLTTSLYLVIFAQFSVFIAHKTFTFSIKDFRIRSAASTYLHVNYFFNVNNVRRFLYVLARTMLILFIKRLRIALCNLLYHIYSFLLFQ